MLSGDPEELDVMVVAADWGIEFFGYANLTVKDGLVRVVAVVLVAYLV